MEKKRLLLRLFFPVVFLLFAGIVVAKPAGKDRPQNVILIGWDGAQRNHVQECLTRGELPNLARLAAEGAIVAIDVLRVTDTKAGWAQILTGYEPEVTGVYSNGRYGPIPKGLTIFERLEEYFGPDRFVTVAVIGKKGNLGANPPVKVEIKPRMAQAKIEQKLRNSGGKLVEENGRRYLVVPGEPYYYAREAMDVFENGLGSDEAVGKEALALLEKYREKPFFFFVHFAEVDHQGHKCGENSEEYTQALISADTWTGKIVAKLKELGLYEKTLVYVTADHGFDEGQKTHYDAPYVFLATNDPRVVRRGTRADITPTILARFGIDLARLTPPLDGRPLTEAYNPPLW